MALDNRVADQAIAPAASSGARMTGQIARRLAA